MYATDVCALEIYHRMQHIEINFYIRYICPDTSIALHASCFFLVVQVELKKKIRAPKFYLGLPEIMCWEPHGLPTFQS